MLLITLYRRLLRVKAFKQTFVINQNLVILPNVSDNFTTTSPSPSVGNNLN